ncbi:MAG: hypothetical protein OIN89_05895 [Candidatus Methanoperedens sp.]|jgi:hypothetical protein|nr:hypothetical protein [Candidatus Methanoperedens sp.]PKL53859.1 MAG: hypothetical protein CVV36_04990 [Candidatus Methanoperedenaceae archaeon HGW-Methanoperedenaceae-1]
MAELGKIDRPNSEKFGNKRKLYVIPVFPFEEMSSHFNLETAKIERFWGEVREKIEHFISVYGNISTLYVEGISEDNGNDLKPFEKYGTGSNHFKLLKNLVDKGAKIRGIDKEAHHDKLKLVYEEYSKSFLPEIKELHEVFFGRDIDFDGWRKFLTDRIQEIQGEMTKFMSGLLEEIPENTNGVLIITEGRVVEYPEGVDVFQVRPPAFDEIVRSLRDKGGFE